MSDSSFNLIDKIFPYLFGGVAFFIAVMFIFVLVQFPQRWRQGRRMTNNIDQVLSNMASGQTGGNDSLDILKRRLASGEISQAEYEQLRKTIDS